MNKRYDYLMKKRSLKRRNASWDSVPIIITLLGDAEARGDKSFPKLFIFIIQLGTTFLS
ncbi:hypothetical protein [Bacillus mycoides]|uniref:hypothetical protein n=1 Tax=Bacillus mycoides TaxID=1405 RepID=UPI00187902C3|nr:hypothetical protein [Bacillus mycoides]